MVVYCSKKICTHNSACCSYYNEKEEVPTCTLEDIFIDDQVECDNFKAEYNKIDICKACSKKTGIISFELDKNIDINFKEAPDLDNKYKK